MRSRVVGLVALVVLAPAVAAPVPKAAPPLYYPTTVGTKWVVTNGKLRMTYTVTGAEEQDGETVVTIESDTGINSRKVEDKRLVSKDGVFGIVEQDKRFVFLKLPAKKGDRWVIEGHDAPGRDEWAGVAGEVEKVKVPAGGWRSAMQRQGDPADDPLVRGRVRGGEERNGRRGVGDGVVREGQAVRTVELWWHRPSCLCRR